MSDDTDSTSEEQKAAAILTWHTWPVVVTLRFPVPHGKRSITELVFQKGRVGLLKGMPTDTMPNADQCMMLASRLCGEPLDVIERLDPDDSAEVMALALGFFARCLTTRPAGKTQ